jgi:hypothetical protein
MDSRIVIKRITIAFVALVISQIAWAHAPASAWYHQLIAECAQRAYGHALSGGSNPDVRVTGQEFAIRVGSAPNDILYVAGSDVTGNLCVLVALFIASPVRLRYRSYLRSIVVAFAILFLVHVAGLYVIVKTALAWHTASGVTRMEGLVADLGPWMYPLGVLLWIPYLLSCCQRDTENGRITRV